MTGQILNELQVASFHPGKQPSIDAMLNDIALEFNEPIFSASYKKMSELYLLPGRHYWVATVGLEVAGTIGLLVFTHGLAVLKNMFVAKRFRGRVSGVASHLLQTAITRAAILEIKAIYLGTMTQFAAAQKFYEKNGFTRIKEEELPAEYPGNAMDTVFYMIKIPLQDVHTEDI